MYRSVLIFTDSNDKYPYWYGTGTPVGTVGIGSVVSRTRYPTVLIKTSPFTSKRYRYHFEKSLGEYSSNCFRSRCTVVFLISVFQNTVTVYQWYAVN